MRKMCGLIVNEYIKIFAKVSTIIMLVVIVVLALGYNGLMFTNNKMQVIYYGSNDSNMFYDQQIQNELQNKQPGWETRVEQYTFLRDNKINDFDWRSAAVYEAFALKETINSMPNEDEKISNQARFDAMINSIRSDDWKTYLKDNMTRIRTDQDIPQGEKDIQLWSMQYRIDHDVKPDAPNYPDSNWKSNLIYTLENNKKMLNEELQKPYAERDQSKYAVFNEAVLIDTYRLDNNIEVATKPDNPNANGMGVSGFGSENFWTVFQRSVGVISFVSVLIIIVAGSAIASEFSGGTIKFLLINPVKRWKILVAKYISVLSAALVMLVICYIFNALLAGLFFGFQDISVPHLYVSGDTVQTGSSFLFVAWKYLLASIGLITMATFAFALSSLTKSSALAIGLGVFLMMAGSGAVLFLVRFKMDWARYLIFANTDLNAIAMKMPPFIGQTIGFALIVIAVYMVVFCLTAWDGFVRRDIK